MTTKWHALSYGRCSDVQAEMQIIIENDGSLLIRWPAHTTAQYRVDYSTSLGENASWLPLTAPLENANGYTQVRPTVSESSRYFRLRKL